MSISGHSAARLERLVGHALLLWGASLPFVGIGTWSFHGALGVELPDLVMVVSSPLFVWLALREPRPVARNWIVVFCALLFAAAFATAVVRGDVALETRDLARHAARLAAVATLVAAGRRGLGDRALIGLATAGSLAAAVSLMMFAAQVARGAGPGAHPWSFVGPMPLMGALPRLTGTAGLSPQHMGEILVATLGALAVVSPPTPRARRARRAALLVTALALFATWSAAWLGALGLGLGWLALRGHLRPAAAMLLAAFAVLAVAWLVYIGPPSSRGAVTPCATTDALHQLTEYLDAGEKRCRNQIRRSPYRSLLTTYRDAAETSVAALVRHPLTGVGRVGYASFARQRALARGGDRVSHVAHYTSPHGIVLGLPACYGALGALCLAALAFLVGSAIRRERDPETLAPWLALAGLLVLGISSDVLDTRVLWALLGGAAAVSPAATESRGGTRTSTRWGS